ncbi:Zn-binding Pro-Ala-Ala-Arg (PAAR) domain-containing protein, incolved in TypeVI secretion [Cnuella takakiae]|uniref:Zn-binding Pro-Ala-Ala-Arg (PAAR) domain-containing protein, incolved in TypeVI secretion n=1 Tax=Cnuella takakiae TaxID=1302690 RepID=A0A1M4ZE42_9BACT|nr:PAAR domain-containing protein [Cnuella takakiae]OLY94239.1 hypothetical protein BUE76_21890 [Cnuella takakiae]SHF16225.1 Zn-binding Pro-Ala-Ala-Arg (PAAR) domain-containing protein, incolved in TypeVI secretion [Cnuella takakiae]
MPSAARISDLTVDGMITGPGVATVLIGGLPAAVAGDISTPASGNVPMAFAVGSVTVLVGGRPVLRAGDTALNGSSIPVGFPMVQIG